MMGRNNGKVPAGSVVYLNEVRIDRQGYEVDASHVYWGVGDTLWSAEEFETGETVYFRAPSHSEALAMCAAKEWQPIVDTM